MLQQRFLDSAAFGPKDQITTFRRQPFCNGAPNALRCTCNQCVFLVSLKGIGTSAQGGTRLGSSECLHVSGTSSPTIRSLYKGSERQTALLHECRNRADLEVGTWSTGALSDWIFPVLTNCKPG